MTFMVPNDMYSLEYNGKQYKSHGMWYSCHMIWNTDAAFIAVFHGQALSYTGGYERNVFLRQFDSDIIHLLPNLEGDILFNPENSCHPRLFLCWTNLHVSQLTGHSFVYYTKDEAQCYMGQSVVLWDMMSRGRHEDLSPAHMTFLDQSYFFICQFNYTRYNKIIITSL